MRTYDVAAQKPKVAQPRDRIARQRRNVIFTFHSRTGRIRREAIQQVIQPRPQVHAQIAQPDIRDEGIKQFLVRAGKPRKSQ